MVAQRLELRLVLFNNFTQKEQIYDKKHNNSIYRLFLNISENGEVMYRI